MKVFIIQSVPEELKQIEIELLKIFPEKKDEMFFVGNFEKALDVILSINDEIIVLSSDMFHDFCNVKFKDYEKHGSKLAEEIKKINSKAKVYIFSSYEPMQKFIDGYFPKNYQSSVGKQMVDIFYYLGLAVRPVEKNSLIKKIFKKCRLI